MAEPSKASAVHGAHDQQRPSILKRFSTAAVLAPERADKLHAEAHVVSAEEKLLTMERFSTRVAIAATVPLRTALQTELEQDGCVVIAKVHARSNGLLEVAEMIRFDRLMRSFLKLTKGVVIKTATGRMFVRYKLVSDAVAAMVFGFEGVRRYNQTVREDLRLSVSMGCHVGKIVVLPGDMYGDPVNVASKLGEDIAEADELLVSEEAATIAQAKGKNPHGAVVGEWVPREEEVSSVLLKFLQLKDVSVDEKAFASPAIAKVLAGGAALVRAPRFPRSFEDVVLKLGTLSPEKQKAQEPKLFQRYGRNVTFIGTDMSGFTRLVKKHGVMHFLRMIVAQRAMVRPIVERHRGEVVNFEGDNINCVFDSASDGVAAAREILRVLAAYNEGVEEDEQVIVKIGCHTGLVVLHDGEIYGDEAQFGEWLAEEVGVKMHMQMSDAVKAQLSDEEFDACKAESKEMEFEGHKHTVYCVGVV